jgi:hypothetical protein
MSRSCLIEGAREELAQGRLRRAHNGRNSAATEVLVASGAPPGLRVTTAGQARRGAQPKPPAGIPAPHGTAIAASQPQPRRRGTGQPTMVGVQGPTSQGLNRHRSTERGGSQEPHLAQACHRLARTEATLQPGIRDYQGIMGHPPALVPRMPVEPATRLRAGRSLALRRLHRTREAPIPMRQRPVVFPARF